MDENQAKQSNLLDTTDCLEAVGVFRGWKNALFVVIVLCLLLLQISFWLIDRGLIEPCDKARGDIVTACKEAEEIKESAEKVAEEPNKSAKAAPQKQPQAGFLSGITIKQVCWAVRIANGLLILTAVLYCLCMLFSLKVSLIGRLGGINHISRAFFLSLILVVLLLPWQIVFDGIIPGVIYTPKELLSSYATSKLPPAEIFSIALYYFRFCGYWVLVVILLIFAQMRSSRWTKAVLRRLEVI